MIPDTKPDAEGIYRKNGELHMQTSRWLSVVMVPAMIGTYVLIGCAAFVLVGILF